MAEETPDYNAITWPIQLTKTVHRSLYPLLDPSNPDLSAAGKTVLITGATGGIGRAIAEAWTVAGAKGVVITGRKVDVLQDLQKRLTKIAGETRIIFVQADITKEEEVKVLWEKAREEVGTIDVLINNAGSLTQMKIGAGEDPGEWWRDFVTTPFLLPLSLFPPPFFPILHAQLTQEQQPGSKHKSPLPKHPPLPPAIHPRNHHNPLYRHTTRHISTLLRLYTE
jgi:hypothetical protein